MKKIETDGEDVICDIFNFNFSFIGFRTRDKNGSYHSKPSPMCPCFQSDVPGVAEEAVDEDEAVGEAESAVDELNGLVKKLVKMVKTYKQTSLSLQSSKLEIESEICSWQNFDELYHPSIFYDYPF